MDWFTEDVLFEASNELAKRGYSFLLRKSGRLALVGKGAFGRTYMVKDVYGQVFAVKIAKRPTEKHVKSNRTFSPDHIDEIVFAQALRENPSDYIVKFYEEILLDNFYILIMELIEGVSLGKLLRTRKLVDGHKLDRNEWSILATCLIKAVCHLQTMGFVHRDIKPDNVMVVLNESMKIVGAKLIDFGLSRRACSEVPAAAAAAPASAASASTSTAFSQEKAYDTNSGEDYSKSPAQKKVRLTEVLMSAVGTPVYTHPAVGKCPYGFECDTYSLGLVLFEAYIGKTVIPPIEERFMAAKKKYWNYPVDKVLEGCDKDVSKVVMLLMSKKNYPIEEALKAINAFSCSYEQPKV